MELTDKQITEIIDYLQGSCNALDDAIHLITEGEANILEEVSNWRELCDRLDQAHFLCSKCGWWSEAGDYAEGEEDVCSDCGED